MLPTLKVRRIRRHMSTTYHIHHTFISRTTLSFTFIEPSGMRPCSGCNELAGLLIATAEHIDCCMINTVPLEEAKISRVRQERKNNKKSASV